MLLLLIISFATTFVCSYVVTKEILARKRMREKIAIANLPVQELVAYATKKIVYRSQHEYLLKATTKAEADYILANRYLNDYGLIGYRRRERS